MKLIKSISIVTLMLVSAASFAVPIFSPGDAILGGQSDGTNFVVGVSGTSGGQNNWPSGESPLHLIDGVGQKYLNFGETNTGAIITSSLGSYVVDSIQFWTANDAEARDPASYSLWGTNDAISGTSIPLSLFNVISTGSLALPSSRNGGGSSALVTGNSQTVAFSNSNAYSSYLLLFPTVKNSASANSMQLAEVQLFGEPTAVSAPATAVLFGLGLAGLGFSRRKKM